MVSFAIQNYLWAKAYIVPYGTGRVLRLVSTWQTDEEQTQIGKTTKDHDFGSISDK